MVFRTPAEAPDTRGVIRISDELRISPSLDVLGQATRGELGEHFLLALGHAGWAPGQLDDEIIRGSWIFIDLDDDLVFDTPIEERYDRALGALGVDPAMIMMRPIDE